MTPTEKHREAAYAVLDDLFGDAIIEKPSVQIVAEHLAKAEREGMKRAAEIARGHIYRERYRTWPWWNGGNRSNESEIVQHSDAIADAILSEAGEGLSYSQSGLSYSDARSG